MREVVKAAVRSTLPEALAEALTMEWTVQEGEVRRPVTAKPAPGEANAEGDADDERSEADGVSGAMSPEATSRAIVGRLARGKELKTDARRRSAR